MPRMTQNDFLNPVLSLTPSLVAVIIWFAGWGSLFLIAWRTDSITSVLLKHPGFMVGDFVLLPLAGFLVAYFYQSADSVLDLMRSKKWDYFSIIFATLFTIVATSYSIFISKHYQGIWSIPHTIFIWFIIYILANFLSKGSYQLLYKPNRYLWMIYIGVLIAISFHIIIKLSIFGAARFPMP